MEKYMKKYHIKSYECDSSFHLRIMSLFNFFQDIADMHAEEMGVGYTFCEQQKIGWVGANYHIQIHRLPEWKENITLLTWPSGTTPVSGIRDFQMIDEKGKVIINASSQWVLVDIEKMRPLPVKKYLPQYEIINERAVETTFPKWASAERADSLLPISVLHDHIDFNNHVNNANYPVWALDSVASDFLKKHPLTEIEVAFKRPALLGDQLTVLTQKDNLMTRHDIKKSDLTLASIRCQWK